MKLDIRTAVIVLTAAAASGSLPAADRGKFVPVTDAMLEHPDPADWLMWRRTPDSWGYSPLDAINRANVAKLELVWSKTLTPGPSQEGIPLVYDGVMYLPNPLDVIDAMDAATGALLWEYRRDLPADVGDFIPYPHTNRNLAIYANLIIDNGAEDYIYAVDAVTGKLAWQTQIFDYKTHPAKQGSAPLVVAGKLISGRNCMPQGGPDTCIITAHDALTGKELWRKRTIPRPGEPNGDTWGDLPDAERWHVGAWLMPSYDPELDLVYVATSVTAPAPKFMLAGNDKTYLYHNSTLALNPDTGETVWYYQYLVDHWDLDHAFERMLLDTAVAPDASEVPWINPRLRRGERRKVITGIPGKTGVVYTLDRATGEFLWARPTIMQNVVAGIDGATGHATVDPARLFTGARQDIFVCPSAQGGKNWLAGAYSPRTNTMYFPLSNTCMTATTIAEHGTPEMVYAFSNETVITPGEDGVGTIQAIAADTGDRRWKYDQRAGVGALVATGGDLLLGGDVAGHFRALDIETGKVLWETDLGSEVTGHPITFAVNGRQFVAVTTGTSNLTGALARLTPDARAQGKDNKLFVFALPD